MEANNDSAIQFELRSESLQEQLDAANQRAADAWAQVEAIAVKGLGLPEVDESDEIPPEWNSSGTLSELVRNWKDCAEAAERKLASLADSFRLFLDECEDLDSDVLAVLELRLSTRHAGRSLRSTSRRARQRILLRLVM